MKKKRTDPMAEFRSAKGDKSSHQKVLTHESFAAELVGGKRHAGSGAMDGLKSDASSDDWQVECKQTEKRSMIIQLDWLEKITREATGCGKIPMLHLRLLAAEADIQKDWVCIPAKVFEKLTK
jgi:hypothetical protein